MRRSLVLLLVAVAVCLPAPAVAHTSLVGSDPRDGAVLATAPSRVTLEFSEPVTETVVALTAPDGSELPVDVSSRDREVTATVDGADQRGTYTVAYRVVSADGHPVSGSRSFDVTSGRAVDQVAAEPTREGFVARHSGHVLWAVLAGVAAVALILGPLLRRRRA